jgi:LuxR family maltose regulon positive regulatory protein
LLNHRWLGLVNQGQLLTVRTWLHQLPTDVVEADPALALAVAWTNLMAGDLDAVSPYLAAARDVTAEEPTLPGASSVASGVALVETLYFRVIGRLSEACDRAEVALELEPGPDAAGRARALAYAGICRFWKGQFDHASRLLNHSAGVADRFGHRMARVLALGYLGLIEAEHKSTDGLRAIVADAEAVIDEAGLYLHPVAAPALAASGLLTVGDNRPEEGLAKLEDALAVASIQAEPGLLAYLNVACAKILDDLGRTEEADRRRLVARGLCRRAEDVGFIAARCGGHDGELASPDVALTGREVTVLQLLTSSLTLPEIASELFVSHNTVKTHVRSLYRKLGVSKREDAVRVAATLGVP